MRTRSPRTVLLALVAFALAALASAGVVRAARQSMVMSKIARVGRDYHALTVAIYALANDNCGAGTPNDTSWRRVEHPETRLTFETVVGANRRDEHDYMRTLELTSPVAYIKSMPGESFNGGATYGYCRFPNITANVFFLNSPGPDGDIDLPLEKLKDEMTERFPMIDEWHMVEKSEDKELALLICERAMPFLYDPTNGTFSSGDLFWSVHKSIGSGKPPKDAYDFSGGVVPPVEWLPPGVPDPAGGTAVGPEPQKLGYLRVGAPEQLRAALRAAGVDESRAQETYDEAVAKLENHFGGELVSFFENPGPLAPAQIAALDAWTAESPDWWRVIRENWEMAGSLPINPEFYTPRQSLRAMIFFGKCEILQAARDMAEGRPDRARARALFVRNTLSGVFYRLPELGGEDEAMRRQIRKTMLSLTETLLTQLPPEPAPAPTAH